MKRQTLFISDLHLAPEQPETAQNFFNFLAELDSTNVEALYILGDLFKLWIGDDDYSQFNETIKEHLSSAGKRIPIYLMAGNRDFLLGNNFAQTSSCVLIEDPHIIDLYGKSTLLTHGDILTGREIKYRLFRLLLRTPGLLSLFLKLPIGIRLWIARQLRQHSKNRQKCSVNKPHLIEPQLHELKKLLDQFTFEQIIYGHVHQATSGVMMVNNKNIDYISLAEWQNSGNTLCCYSNPTVIIPLSLNKNINLML
jgi:UDP-2,3-diacylglucosamine hydrolase